MDKRRVRVLGTLLLVRELSCLRRRLIPPAFLSQWARPSLLRQSPLDAPPAVSLMYIDKTKGKKPADTTCCAGWRTALRVRISSHPMSGATSTFGSTLEDSRIDANGGARWTVALLAYCP